MENRFLCRGKRVDNGEWVEGFLMDENYINTPFNDNEVGGRFDDPAEIDESTLCQCTGLKDKNGKLIWENDIGRDAHGNFYKAFWQNNYYQFSWICVKSDVFSIGAKWDLWSFRSFEIEVIGNIFDNPELLEE